MCPPISHDGSIAPIKLSESIYNIPDSDDNKIYNDQLVIWKIDNRVSEKKCKTICDIDSENYLKTNDEQEKKSEVSHPCSCFETLEKLKKVFEMTDEEVNVVNLRNNTFPGEFTNMSFDLDKDEVVEDLDSCDLNDDYLLENSSISLKIIESINSNDGFIEKSIPDIDKNSVTDRHKLKLELPEQNKKSKEIISNTPSKSMTSISYKINKKASSKSKKSSSNVVKSRSKNTKKRFKCCMEVDSLPELGEKEKIRNIKYVYTYGDNYRGGIQRGHKHCVIPWSPIPKDKGWITEKYRRSKLMNKNINNSKKHEINDDTFKELENNEYLKKRTDNIRTPKSGEYTFNNVRNVDINASEKSLNNNNLKVPGPALMMNKKNGIYTITMNSLGANGIPENSLAFRLGENPDANTASSTSSLDLELFPPEAYSEMYRNMKSKENLKVDQEKLEDLKKTEKKRKPVVQKHAQIKQ